MALATAPAAPEDTPNLLSLLHGLPQELFDLILDLAFLPPRATEIKIDRGYASPISLRINKIMRAKFAKRYYAQNPFYADNLETLARWLLSLPDKYQDKLRKITWGRDLGSRDGRGVRARNKILHSMTKEALGRHLVTMMHMQRRLCECGVKEDIARRLAVAPRDEDGSAGKEAEN